MTSKLACPIACALVLALAPASAQTSGRGNVTPAGPMVDTSQQRTRALTNAELSARVVVLEAQVAQLASRVETLNALVADYPAHRHNFNDDISEEVVAHDITGLPHQ